MQEKSVFFRFHPSLKQVIQGSLKWQELRPIQELAFPPVRSGMNVLLIARTAGGKSEAAFLPVLDQILQNHPELPVCLYIAPLRALITDITSRLDQMLFPLHLTSVQVHGDSPAARIDDADPPAVVLTTPESLLILLERKEAPLLHRIRVCIIDEVHALAASERGAQLMATLQRIEHKTGNPIQRIGLSATVANPEEILAWMSGSAQPSQVIHADQEPLLREFTFLTGWDGTDPGRIPALIRGKRSLIFVQSRSAAEHLAELLEEAGILIHLHHSSLSSGIRKTAEDASYTNREVAIICTSTLELGIDLGSLDQIVQIGPGTSVSSFLQRLGRVGRRGDRARMVFILKDSHEVIRTAALITAASARRIEHVCPSRFPYRAIVQQLILSLLSSGRAREQALIQELKTTTVYAGIPQNRFHSILDNLISLEYVIRDRGFLMPGRALESWVGCMKGSLYSVIGGEPTCLVRSGSGEDIGSLPLAFAEQVNNFSFRLGGRSWKRSGAHFDSPSLRVSEYFGPADPPTFGGSFQGMSFLLATEVGRIVQNGLSDLPFPVLVGEALSDVIRILPTRVGPDSLVIRKEGDHIAVYTFFGDEWNRVLGAYLKRSWRNISGKKISIISDAISIRLTSDTLSPDWIQDQIQAFYLPSIDESGDWVDMISDPVRAYDQMLPAFCLREMKMYDQLRIDELEKEICSRKIILE